LASRTFRKLMHDADTKNWCRCFLHRRNAILNYPLVVSQFIETMKLLRVQRLQNSVKAVCDYLRADGPFKGISDYSTPFQSSNERNGLQLHTEMIPMWIVRLCLEIMFANSFKELKEDIISRVADIQFTRKLFLHVAEVHILLTGHDKTLIQAILTSKRTSAQSESPAPFLGFWVPTISTHAITPLFQGMAQRPRGHSEAPF
jgi:hypothetical protein